MDAKRSAHADSSLQIPAHLEGFSLPGWIYRDEDFLEAEKERVFATSWQVICHLNDIPNPGDYHTLDFLGEPLVAVRGQDHGVKTILGRTEVSLRSFARHIRELIPESRLDRAPGAGWHVRNHPRINHG